jgi:hypothetical protein
VFTKLLGGVSPPKANADVDDPDPPNWCFAVARSATSVQEVPFQDSVFAVLGGPPPKAKAEVLAFPGPAPAKR